MSAKDETSVLQRYCDKCGRPFEIDRPAEAPHKRFCSKKCRIAYHNDQAKAKRQAARQAPSDAWRAWREKVKYERQD